ncbi:MAG: ribosomal L7Ae/L30e/S12e/Gadd45 family protein [Aquificae bacterium]|nr:ribosomal L7Ae/L30e/S12e/Gadd45 family protein [Aquificota bacterium]
MGYPSERERFLKRLKELLTFTHRTGRVFFGLDTAKELVSRRYRGFLIVAADASPRVDREVSFFRKKGYNFYKLPVGKEELGSWFGKRTVGVLFLPNANLTYKIEQLLRDGRRWLLKPGEVEKLEAERVRRTAGRGLQKVKANFNRNFGARPEKNKGLDEGNRGPEADDRPPRRGPEGGASSRTRRREEGGG